MSPPPTAPPPEGGRGSSDDRPLLTIKPENASLVTLHATGSTTLATINPFLIKKGIDFCAGAVSWVRKLASGDLLIKTVNSSQVKDLLKLRMFHEYNVVATIPVAMNSCKGVISCRDFLYMEEKDIIEGMEDQDVIAVRHITRFVDGNRRKTATVILTFGKSILPDYTYVGYEKCNVRPYIPNPLRCFKCQTYGHHGKSCRSSKIMCGKCAGEGHAAEQCTSETLKCAACGAAHSISSRDCPVWVMEKKVCTVKALEGISYFDARKKVKESLATPKPGVSYASVVNAKPQMCSVGTQTCSVSTQTEPTPVAPSTPSTSDASLTIDLTPTTETSTTTTSYSDAIANSNTKTTKKNNKTYNKDNVNLTPLNRNTLSHVIARPAPTRETSRSRSSSCSVESRDMEVTTNKHRERSPGGGRSPRHKKRTKRTDHPKNS